MGLEGVVPRRAPRPPTGELRTNHTAAGSVVPRHCTFCGCGVFLWQLPPQWLRVWTTSGICPLCSRTTVNLEMVSLAPRVRFVPPSTTVDGHVPQCRPAMRARRVPSARRAAGTKRGHFQSLIELEVPSLRLEIGPSPSPAPAPSTSTSLTTPPEQTTPTDTCHFRLC